MEYVSLGNSGLKVSAIGLGTWVARRGNVDGEYLTQSVRRAYELGVNFFDTANEYNGGRSEELLGHALRPFSRGSFVVATKACLPVDEGPTNCGLSRKHLVEQVRASRKRLRVDTIDLLQCHDWDPGTPLEETCSALSDLVRNGEIHYWGVSNWSASQVAHAVEICRSSGWPAPISLQSAYSLLDRDIEHATLPAVGKLGLGVMVWSPLAMGVLTGKYSRGVAPDDRAAIGDEFATDYLNIRLTPETLAVVDRIAALADDLGCSLPQFALAWCLRSQHVSSVLVGVSKVAHVVENVEAVNVELSDEVILQTDAVLEGTGDSPSRYITGTSVVVDGGRSLAV